MMRRPAPERADRRRFLTVAGAAGLGGIAWSLIGAPGLAQLLVKEIHELQPGEFNWHRERSPEDPTPPTSVLVSGMDQRILILENGEIVAGGRAIISDPAVSLGDHVFILTDTHDARQGMAWHAIGYHCEAPDGFVEPEEAVIRRLRSEPHVIEAMKVRMHPGMVLVMTDLPAHADTRSGTDFVIMTHDVG